VNPSRRLQVMELTLKPLISASGLSFVSPVVVLDARDRSAYEAGHWPGAVHLDIKQWERLARTAEGALDCTDVWAEKIGLLGIDGLTPAVVYDDGRMTEAARAWFVLQLQGVEVAVLDGGWSALTQQADFAADQAESRPLAMAFQRPASHVPLVRLINRQALREELGRGIQVLDARTLAEHVGDDLRSNARGGHLPGAKSVPHAELLSANGTLKTGAELRARIALAGVTEAAPVVTHCDAGGRGALAALAAAMAGQQEVYAYYLSFSDWAADDTCPVV